jgi:peptidoglycan hydrolase-like protein with peptidoglycan-binding domain
MLSRRAKIIVCACAAASAAVWCNVMYLQQDTRSDLLARSHRLGEAQSRPSMAGVRPEAEHRAGAGSAARPGPASLSDAEHDPDVVRAVQRELAQRGYAPGLADGLAHPVTRAAVMAYEHDHGMPLTGEPSDALLKAILFGLAPGPGTSAAVRPSTQAEEIIRTVQQSLAALGYGVGAVDGRMGEETIRAIRKFETQQGLPQSGRISGTLLVRLTEATVRRQRRALAQ